MGLCIIVLPLPLGIAALAGVSLNNPLLLPLFIVAFLAGGAVTTTNDIIDIERDKRNGRYGLRGGCFQDP
jgi:4-hydroxybenzoate polyprenyltransferase